MARKKNLIQKSLQNKRYKAIEKISHESEMRLKSWAIENSIYSSPFWITILGWYMYVTILNMQLPYGEEIAYVQPMAFILTFISVIVSFFAFIYIRPMFEKEFKRETAELSEDVYQKGAKFSNLENFNKQISKYIQSEYNLSLNSKTTETFKIPMIQLEEDDKQFYENIEDLKLPRISLATGLCLMGAPGQGKSVFINQILSQTPTNAKQIIIDVKGEFLEKHYDDKTDYILCPSDIRSVRFNLVNLLKSKIDIGIIAETIVSDENSNDPHWINAARTVMEAILVYASKRNLSNSSIYQLISKPSELRKILNDEDASLLAGQYLFFTDGGDFSKETKSVLSTLARKAKILQYLSYLDDLGTKKIYLDEWIKNGKGGKIFLLATDNLSKIFTPLYGVITSYFISTLLDEDDSIDKDYYFILDEMPRLGKVLGTNLEKALAVGRSKGIKVLMAMQSYSQIKKEYGDKEAESIFDTTNSFIVFKNNYGAQFLEKMFGKTTIIRNNESFSFGMSDMADRSQLQRQLVTENLIDDSEITRLSKFEFYTKIEGVKDVLKGKLKPVFIGKNGTKKYIENSSMNIVVLTAEMEKVISDIENRYVSFKKSKKISSLQKRARVEF